MNKLTNGSHKILFSKGKLYLDGIQIAGDGITPDKEIVFDFQVNKPEEIEKKEIISRDPSVLEVNVYDSVIGKAVGPGQI
jgi:hypothetical protein